MEKRSHFKLEHRKERPLSQREFISRMGAYVAAALLLIFGVLAIAMSGYHYLEGMRWIDAFLSAAMILGGMGQASTLTHDSAKLFAGSYALFSGLFFFVIAGLILTPIIHRILHRFHFDEEGGDISS